METRCIIVSGGVFSPAPEQQPGDFVIVPVGEDRHEEIARIESIEYHVKEEAPYPFDKIKHILRKFDRKTDEGLLR